jgi:hypothetical protein
LILLILFALFSLQGFCSEDPPPHTVEAKVGYFFFSDPKMRKIFNEGGIDVQLSRSYTVWEQLQIYAGVEFLQRRGQSLASHKKTAVWEIPLSLGVKPVIPIGSIAQAYFTIGPKYFFARENNHYSGVDRIVNNNGLGGFVNVGFNFFPLKHMLIDLFAEYSYKRMEFHAAKEHVYARTIQIGGFCFGVGFGYAF